MAGSRGPPSGRLHVYGVRPLWALRQGLIPAVVRDQEGKAAESRRASRQTEDSPLRRGKQALGYCPSTGGLLWGRETTSVGLAHITKQPFPSTPEATCLLLQPGPRHRGLGTGTGPSPAVRVPQAILRLPGHVATAGQTLDLPLIGKGLLFLISDPVSREIHPRVL